MKKNETLFILRLWYDEEKWCASLKNKNKEVKYFSSLKSLTSFLQKWGSTVQERNSNAKG